LKVSSAGWQRRWHIKGALALMFRELERDVREFGFAVRCVEAHLLWIAAVTQ
jgi:hypothetical protein